MSNSTRAVEENDTGVKGVVQGRVGPWEVGWDRCPLPGTGPSPFQLSSLSPSPREGLTGQCVSRLNE